ncbi:MAG: hypothetical protein LDL41_03100 [Coleofasciculus sp. S288]|nr:hypothetical protein [Coleofasciculus sp. S288]
MPKAFIHSANTPRDMNPQCLDQWFSIEKQRNYILKIKGRVGLTPRRAECFVRLCAYLLLKQQEFDDGLRKPLTQLHKPKGFVPCTHREAAELFYAHTERGSDRSAGMMLDKLCDLGLIEKKFDGNTINIQIRYLPEFSSSPKPVEPIQLEIDAFKPSDAILVAKLLAHLYRWLNNDTATVSNKIKTLLREWVKQYPTGMRVLRRCDNYRPVGFSLIYPVAPDSEKNFFVPPSKTLHLCSDSDIDPFQIALPGMDDCTSAFVRSWRIDTPYLNRDNVRCLLEDTQKTLVQMQSDFPNLCDLYIIIVHPVHSYIELALALGFQKIGEDPNSPVYWMYTPVERFVKVDLKKALSKLQFTSYSPEF